MPNIHSQVCYLLAGHLSGRSDHGNGFSIRTCVHRERYGEPGEPLPRLTLPEAEGLLARAYASQRHANPPGRVELGSLQAHLIHLVRGTCCGCGLEESAEVFSTRPKLTIKSRLSAISRTRAERALARVHLHRLRRGHLPICNAGFVIRDS